MKSVSKDNTASWETNAFVEATPISGPAWLYTPASVSRAIDEPTTLTKPKLRTPFLFASFNAPCVSAVSPDWVADKSAVLASNFCFLYLNSEAYSTSTDIPPYSSRMYSPVRPARYAVPQAEIIIRSEEHTSELQSQFH